MRLSCLLRGVCNVACDTEIEHVTINSKEVTKGDLFIALRGEHTDGENFVGEALLRGAAAVVSERIHADARVVTADSAASAAAKIFSNYYGNPTDSMEVVAVTGTNGKTSTASAISRILSSAGRHVGVIGSAEFSACGETIDKDAFFGESSTMTTPDADGLYRAASFLRDRGCDVLVAEASSHALSASRFDGMKISLGVFTNLSPEHLDFHDGMESYFEAKATLAEKVERLVTNCDDPYGRRMFYKCRNSFGVGTSDGLFARADNIALRPDGIEYDLVTDAVRCRISSPMMGMFSVYNTLEAAASAILLGVAPEVIPAALDGFAGAKGRMETVASGDGIPRVIIDYAHTPYAAECAVTAAKSATAGRLIAVIGCGGDRDRTKRAPTGRAVSEIADYTVVTSDNPRSEDPEKIISDVVSGIENGNYEAVTDRTAAIRRAIALARPVDTVLILGKGHENYVIDKCGKHPYDEIAAVRSALFEKYGKNI